jgi:hypothetical protein
MGKVSGVIDTGLSIAQSAIDAARKKFGALPSEEDVKDTVAPSSMGGGFISENIDSYLSKVLPEDPTVDEIKSAIGDWHDMGYELSLTGQKGNAGALMQEQANNFPDELINPKYIKTIREIHDKIYDMRNF